MPESQKVYKPNIAKGMVSILLATILIFFMFVLPFLGFILILHGILQVLAALALFLFLAIPLSLAYMSFKVQSYELRNDGVFVRKGIFSKTQALLLYSEVQDVQESQGIMENILGIGSLRITTMSQSFPIVLVALDKPELDEMRDFILNRASKSNKKVKIVEISKVKEDLPEKPFYEIHPLKKGLVSMTIITFIVALFAIPLSLILGAPFIFLEVMIIIIFTFIFFIILVSTSIAQISFRLKVSGKSIIIGSEFLSRNFINLPYDKVQDVGLARGLFDRLLRMATITIETGEAFAPTTGGKSKIPLNSISDLYEEDAFDLRRIVLTKSGIEDLKTYNLRDKFPLENIKPLKKSVSATFWLFVVIGVLTIIVYPLNLYWGGILTLLLLVLPIIVFIVKIVYEIFYFKSYYYSDNSEILVLRKGVLTITEVTVPYEKIQNIFVNRDMFDRVFGLYDVHLSTVGKISQMELHIDGISKKNSEDLKTLLSRRVH